MDMQGQTQNLVLTPDQLKKEACKKELQALLIRHGFTLIPVVTIVGRNMTTMVELAEIPKESLGAAVAAAGGIDGGK